MKNWILCDGSWTNFDRLDTIWIKELGPCKFKIYALRAATDDIYELFEKVFDSEEEAQLWLNYWMNVMKKQNEK